MKHDFGKVMAHDVVAYEGEDAAILIRTVVRTLDEVQIVLLLAHSRLQHPKAWRDALLAEGEGLRMRFSAKTPQPLGVLSGLLADPPWRFIRAQEVIDSSYYVCEIAVKIDEVAADRIQLEWPWARIAAEVTGLDAGLVV